MAIGGFGSISDQLGSSFGGKTYTSRFFAIPLNFGPRGRAEQPNYTTPSAPSPTPPQQTLPTSKYGDTIPVVWGTCRIPGSYIWAPDFQKDSTSGEVITTLRARIRFGRPLVENSNWRLRRLWSNGKIIWNKANGYRSPLITRLIAYDGQSTQRRDALQVEVEGEDNVSAHRGYLDIVITMQLTGERQPPSFDAEWVQDATAGAEEDEFVSFASDEVSTYAGYNFDSGIWYGFTDGDTLRAFSVGLLHELYSVPVTGLGGYSSAGKFCRYIPEINRVIALASIFLGNQYPILVNPLTGAVTAFADDPVSSTSGVSQTTNASCVVMVSSTTGILVHSCYHLGYLAIYRFTATEFTRLSISAAAWDSRGIVDCIAKGAVGGSTIDLWMVAGSKLWKMVLTTGGVTVSLTEHATFSDDPVYCIYHDGDVVVWDDALGIHRIDGSTGSTVWTTTVPYQINVTSPTQRAIGDPDMLRVDDTFFYPGHYLTDLSDGSTETTSGTTGGHYVWDEYSNTAIRTGNLAEPVRILLDVVSEGSLRDLEDLISAIWEADDDYSSSEHDEVNINDQLLGAVVDITTGKREVVRSLAEPYSFSILERSAEIITRRALTDGSFAVDGVLAASDFKDVGGQAITATKNNPKEFIARYGITHRDPTEIYQAKTQYGEIQFTPYPVSPTDISTKQDIPVIDTATRMKTLATKKVRRLAEEKHVFVKTLRAKHLDKEPEDIIEFSFAGRTINARVLESTINPDFTIDLRSTEFLSKVDATVTGADGRPSEPQSIGTPASSYYHLDIPLLSDGHDLGGVGLVQYHVLASQGQDNWDGATLYRDNVAVASQNVDGLVGIAQSALPDWDIPYVTEFTRTIDVTFITGDTSTLASATYQEMCEGANMFAIGAPGRWEVCHVMDITDNGGGSFTFTGLRRGRGVSEEHTGDHEIGDFVVWLSGANVQRLEYAIADLNDAFSYKAVGFGGTVAGTTAVSRTVTGEAEKIPKPAHLDAAIDGSDIDLSWIRRSRIGAYWADDGDDTYTAPLGESLEQYVVRILDGPGGAQLRSFTVNDATTKTYLAADITTDFGSMPSELTFTVRQVSGTGVTCPTREQTITL